jgi:hypothetical protein
MDKLDLTLGALDGSRVVKRSRSLVLQLKSELAGAPLYVQRDTNLGDRWSDVLFLCSVLVDSEMELCK